MKITSTTEGIIIPSRAPYVTNFVWRPDQMRALTIEALRQRDEKERLEKERAFGKRTLISDSE